MPRKIGLLLFGIVWIGILLMEYLLQHDWYIKAAQYFAYYEYLIVLILAIGIGTLGLYQRKKKGITASPRWLNGLSLFGVMYVVCICVTFLFFGNVDDFEFSIAGLQTLSVSMLGQALALYLCVGVCYVIGDLVFFLFPIKLPSLELTMLKIAMGIMLLVGLMFLLGIFHLLNVFVIFGIFLLFMVLNIPGALSFVKKSLWKPIPIRQELNGIGLAAFAVSLTFVSLNFVQVIRPIPLGFDDMTLYMRLPSLIHDYQGLVQGFQPYNWSLFMSLGYLLFDSVAVTMGLSWLGGLLALFALYALARKWMDMNLALLSVALFYTMPMINFMSYQDMKIDMGLLFISLCSLFVLFYAVKSKELAQQPAVPIATKEFSMSAQPKKKSKSQASKQKRTKKAQSPSASVQKQLKPFPFLIAWRNSMHEFMPQWLKVDGHFVLLGLMLGFALGVKFTSFILVASILVVIWYDKENNWGSLGAMLMAFCVILLLRLDEFSGLRAWHDNIWISQLLLGAGGIALIGFSYWKYRKKTVSNLIQSLIIMSFLTISFAPWLLKNLDEIDSYSVENLINGKKAFPNFSQNETLKKLQIEARKAKEEQE